MEDRRSLDLISCVMGLGWNRLLSTVRCPVVQFNAGQKQYMAFAIVQSGLCTQAAQHTVGQQIKNWCW
jgi:hypothetical protein